MAPGAAGTVLLAGGAGTGHSAASRPSGSAVFRYATVVPGGFPMSDAVKIGFVPFSATPKGVLVLFTDESLKFGPASAKILGGGGRDRQAGGGGEQLQGQERQLARYPCAVRSEGRPADRGRHRQGRRAEGRGLHQDRRRHGRPAEIRYRFRHHRRRTARWRHEAWPTLPRSHRACACAPTASTATRPRRRTTTVELKANVSIAVADVGAAKKAFAPADSVTDGVLIARDLVNEPPNVLYPEEFAKRASNCASSASQSRSSTRRR